MPVVEISFLYFLAAASLLITGATFLVLWSRMVNGLTPADAGYDLSRVVTGIFIRLTIFQVLLVVLAAIFWLAPEVLPRGTIGLTIQLLYLVALAWGVHKVFSLR